jgi:DNA-binding NarL/FixJ family response regulator
VRRVRGELAAAEDAYRAASRSGREPQPGLALLRLAQGQADAAAGATRRLAAETTAAVERVAVLPAHVEVMLAIGAIDEAHAASRELAVIAGGFESELLNAVVAQARGAVGLASGDARAALAPLRQAVKALRELDVPYETARAQVLVALACRALGDEDSATFELEAARDVFEELGAAPDVSRVDALTRDTAGDDTHGLTARELDVLRLVAAGATNKAIAARLVISERTVDRHVSNILAKVGAPSRAAATAYAYEHQLV